MESFENKKRSEAACKIQRFWRRYIDLQVFKYYKDLVLFHNEGDPALIMRYINPNEAKFIDSASGIHIKFRLAGYNFPPTIYYKIFTHRPIQDLCANAPRDYTRPSYKQKTANVRNNKDKSFPQETFEGWYRRVENNGWRPVSNKHLVQMNMDYYYGYEKSSKPTVFYHSKLLRKQDLELKKKKRKIEWMKQMYKHGMLEPTGNNEETNDLIKKAAKSLLKSYERNGVDSIQDWEVDELIEWTNALDFDDYQNNWKTIGTTAKSDKLVYEEHRLKEPSKFDREDTFQLDDSIDFLAKDSISSTPVQSKYY